MNIPALVLLTATSACSVAQATTPRSTSTIAQAHTETARFEVEGMACQSCAGRLQAGIRKVDGVTKAEVDFPSKTLTVQYDASKIDAARIKAEIERLGFEAKPASATGRAS